MTLIPVESARKMVLDGAKPHALENVPIAECANRILAADLTATRTQPPFDASAMDGFAVRAVDVAKVPVNLRVIGVAAAGHRFGGTLGPGDAVRIFTGAPVPGGTDAIVIQENTEADGDQVVVKQGADQGRYIRPAGFDFATGDVLLRRGAPLKPAALCLAAAMNHDQLPVVRRPLVALIATGDELVAPGTEPGPDQIVASNGLGVAAIVANAGGVARDLGIVRDTDQALSDAIATALGENADIIVTLGGASVGDHDLVKPVMQACGFHFKFLRIAMRPGKPMIFGAKGTTRFLGLPGNPASCLVTGLVFLDPLVRALAGRVVSPAIDTVDARLKSELPANGRRQDFMRATLTRARDGSLLAEPFGNQDSSLLRNIAHADGLLIRPVDAAPAKVGDTVQVMPLGSSSIT